MGQEASNEHSRTISNPVTAHASVISPEDLSSAAWSQRICGAPVYVGLHSLGGCSALARRRADMAYAVERLNPFQSEDGRTRTGTIVSVPKDEVLEVPMLVAGINEKRNAVIFLVRGKCNPYLLTGNLDGFLKRKSTLEERNALERLTTDFPNDCLKLFSLFRGGRESDRQASSGCTDTGSFNRKLFLLGIETFTIDM